MPMPPVRPMTFIAPRDVPADHLAQLVIHLGVTPNHASNPARLMQQHPEPVHRPRPRARAAASSGVSRGT